ncbi:Zn-ribbon domain-containing OB-fold protein [Dermatobacter hominis]|uniref:Zn-ribbon domain-containing OB-fold protein n=1 Tax=Dermatobacter hominis TaxID=2884263 RepID=UPI001D0FEC29|nr:OB-fold domain-containing protein [Dermatobacter hominis]UDY37754.1 OB-fold domain-containing protein [Dermatobacter hominis]
MSTPDVDRTISTLPDGLWSQPEPSVPDLGVDEPVQRLRMPAAMVYDYTPGLAQTRFLRGLQQKKFLGERCPTTGEVYIPPRGVSPVSGLPTTEQVEVGPKATITSFCVVHIGFGVNAPPTPFVSALFLPDGASVSLYGTMGEVDYDKVRIGMRVEPVWVDDDQLTTSMENISHWRPIDEPDVPAEQLKGHM